LADRQKTGVFETDVLVALERVETHIESLVGNGQPGKIKLIEDAIDSLVNWRNVIVGGGIVIVAIMAWLFYVAVPLLAHK
jgi:hypothetical protein